MNSLRNLFVLLLACAWTGNPSASAQTKSPQINRAIADAGVFLRKELEKNKDSGEASLAAYALIKAGQRPSDPLIQAVIANAVKRCGGTSYSAGPHGVYTAGVELMLLEAADPIRYRAQMESIVRWLISQQHDSGGWDYVNNWRGGDTSQCQYATLGLWAAERAGIEVPERVWDKAALWFMRAQGASGGSGLSYHPFGDKQRPDLVVSHGMSAAGASGLMIARLHLYPNAGLDKPQNSKPAKYGVLEKVDLDTVEGSTEAADYEPKASSKAIYESAKRALGWVAGRFTVKNEISSTGHRGPYYLYTIERTAALFDVQQIAGRDWYREGANYLMSQQLKDGSWNSDAGHFATTSLAVLFFLRTTGKQLNRVDPLAGGLLTGGRGLPDDLGKAILKDGKVESTKDLGPIDQLLQELEKIEDVDIGAVQEELVEKVTLGDREELIKQKDRIFKLAKHPNAEVKRTALWALGRTQDLEAAKLLLEALDDNNVDVMVEARNALCVLSLKPLGFGLPESPYEDLPDSATQEQKDKAVEAWREKLKEKWGGWYYKYRAYEKRDDLSELLFKKKT